MKNLLLLTLMLGILSACSSSKKERVPEDVEHEEIKRDYTVRDASSGFRPGWVEDAEIWAKKHGKNTKKYRYFSYETEPKVSRSISCNIAKANARADIAGEIAAFIDKSLGTSTQGNASINENNPQVEELRQYAEHRLAEKVQASVHGAAVEKTYWEKRQYSKKKGAKKDFMAYTCAVFVRMDGERLKSAVEKAANHVVRRTDDPKTKQAVREALRDAAKNFEKIKTGEI